jgi:hypothetical protein
LINEEIKSRVKLGNACYHSVKKLLTSCALFKNKKIQIYKTEEYTLRVHENRLQRRIFRPKSDEITGGLRKLHNGELHNLYSLPCVHI